MGNATKLRKSKTRKTRRKETSVALIVDPNTNPAKETRFDETKGKS